MSEVNQVQEIETVMPARKEFISLAEKKPVFILCSDSSGFNKRSLVKNSIRGMNYQIIQGSVLSLDNYDDSIHLFPKETKDAKVRCINTEDIINAWEDNKIPLLLLNISEKEFLGSFEEESSFFFKKQICFLSEKRNDDFQEKNRGSLQLTCLKKDDGNKKRDQQSLMDSLKLFNNLN